MSEIVEKISFYSSESGVTGKITKASYIDRLFPHLGANQQVLLVCKFLKEREKKIEKNISLTLKESLLEETEFEVTGSPLEHDFGDDSFNASITHVKKNWMQADEYHVPISRTIAMQIFNLFQEDLGDGMYPDWNQPIFTLVKPNKNEDNTVLIGIKPFANWFITMEALLAGTRALDKIPADLNVIMKDHMKTLASEDVNVSVSSVYEIFGHSYLMTDWKYDEFPGFLKVETNWNSFSFVPPSVPAPSSTTMSMEIAIGSKASPLSGLWNEVILLDKYLSILEDYQAKGILSRYSVLPLKFPDNFETPYRKDSSEILERLQEILSEVDNDLVEIMEHALVQELTTSEEDYEVKLADIVKVLGKRKNFDFTDKLWQVLRSAENSETIIECLYLVFETIYYKSDMSFTGGTIFARMVGNINPDKPHVPQLAGSLPLEIVIDIGMEKLDRDFLHLLSVGNLMDVQDFRDILGNVSAEEFDSNKYREKLMKLAEIHMSLEFLNLIQNQFDNSCCDIFPKLFEATRKNTKSLREASSLQDNDIYPLSLPAPRSFIPQVFEKSPTSWTCTLTSERKFEKFISTTIYSKMPIFPPNIYEQDQDFDDEEGEIYHVTKAFTSMTQFGLLN